jgi:hypothetical protein
MPFVIGMYEGQLKRLTPQFLKDVDQYTKGRSSREFATIERREVCVGLRDGAELAIEEEGLVLMPSNEREVEFMYACCGDCCGILEAAKSIPRPADFLASNFYASERGAVHRMWRMGG